jgi:DNA repair exonuclease SbcCD ATPase subunit
MGHNGCGKTTVLKAIRWLITGTIESSNAKAEDYIDNRFGASSAFGRLEFEQSGESGYIERKMFKGGRSTRKLVWNNCEPVTSAADVDAKLNELFKYDRNAAIASCFIPQGELVNYLFGGQTERETLFMKLLMMSDLDRISTKALKMSQELLDGVPDVSVLMDSLDLQLRDWAAQIEATSRALEDITRGGALQQDFESVAKALALIDENERFNRPKLLDLNRQYKDQHDSFSNEVRMRLPGFSWSKPSEVVEHLATALAENAGELASLQFREAEVQVQLKLCTAEEDRLLAVSRLRTCTTACEELRTRVGPDRASLAEGIAVIKSLNEARAAVKAAHEKHVMLSDFAGTCSTSQLEQMETAYAAAEARAAESKKWHALLTTLSRQAAGMEKCDCPLCGAQPGDQSEQSIAERLVEAKAVMDKHSAEAESLRRHVVRLKETRREEESRAASAAAQLATLDLLKRQMLEKEQLVNQLDEDLLALSLDSLELALREAASLEADVAKARADKASAERDVERTTKRVDEIVREAKTQDVHVGATIALDALKKEDADIKARFAVVVNEAAGLTSLRRRCDQYTRQADKLNADMQTQAEAVDDTLDKLDALLASLRLNESGLQDEHARLKAQLDEKNRLDGALRQLGASRESTSAEYARLVGIQQTGEKRKEAAATLKRVAELCARSGLPMLVMRKVFEHVAVKTDDLLAGMESRFSVSMDPEVPLSFLFTRADVPGALPLSQKQLSGGERVLLSIAFILAVHMLVLPELGFLELDEPSTHLDFDVVGNINEMLGKMALLTRGADFQLMISDHHKELTNFDKIVRLALT